MEPGNGAAGDGYTNVGPNRPWNDRTATRSKFSHKGHFHGGVHKEQSKRQSSDDSNLHVCAQVIPRCEQKPNGQSRRAETVDRQYDRKALLAECEQSGDGRFPNGRPEINGG